MQDLDLVEAARVAYTIRICQRMFIPEICLFKSLSSPQVIPTVVTLYDHLITFDREIELVWKKPRTLAKILFLWNRYFGTIFLLTNATLFSVPPTHDNFQLRFLIVGANSSLPKNHPPLTTWINYQLPLLVHLPGMGDSNYCLVYAKIAAFVSFVCEVASMAAILIFAFVTFEASDAGYIFCIPNHIPRFFYAFWIPVIALDCIYFVLALWTLVRRRERGLSKFASSPTSVVETLARDSLMYFFVTLLTYVANAVVWIVLPARWVGLPQAFSMAGTSIMGVKLAFNLRGVYYSHSISMKSDGRMVAAVQDPGFNNENAGAITVRFRVLESTPPSKDDNSSSS
ncbi:hypothetical protein D9756_000805 [Leucocoprinus leucothites]|uniref:DUF6533 domain-containing protein n=1 Tax=Leucocoprinus leucothites TaxID=201217 RepID=A0A8H5GFL4_9AGAR|nr:hypothetical protein D9756_000805 [Leucoagaricus leucothites]